MCDCLGKGISNICYVLNPQIVVLGGGIMAQEEYLRPRLEKALARYLVSSIYEKTELAFAKHQNDAGMRGPTIIFWRDRERPKADRHLFKAARGLNQEEVLWNI